MSGKKQADCQTLGAILKTIADEDGVLIGGMAVDFWRGICSIKSNVPNLTRDIDFFGGRSLVGSAARKLRAGGETVKEFYSSLDDSTPNSGKLAIYRNNCDPIEIDFLYRVDNVSNDDIEGLAITAEIGSDRIKVVHPLILLEMKIGNLAYYPAKRNRAGVEQARISVLVAANHLEQIAEQRDLLNAIERIIRFAGRDPALYAKSFHKVDAMASITDRVIQACGENFQDIRLPQVRQLLQEKELRFDAMIERMHKAGLKAETMRF